jgi:hypothetical protein
MLIINLITTLVIGEMMTGMIACDPRREILITCSMMRKSRNAGRAS